MNQDLTNWREYLSTDDYTKLVTHVDNAKEGLRADKMVVLYGNGNKSNLEYDR